MAKRTFAVIGLGRFGAAMATTLSQLGHEVIGIDGDDDRVTALADQVSHTVKLDATHERALRAAGIKDVDVAVVSIGENIESRLLVVTLVKELGIPNIVAKAVTPLHGRILEKLGVSRVLLSFTRAFAALGLPREQVREIGLRARFGLTTIAIKRAKAGPGEVATVSPGPDDVVQDGDILALLGSNERLGKLEQMLKG